MKIGLEGIGQQCRDRGRQEYKKPMLCRYGSIAQVTENAGPKLNNADGGVQPNHKTGA